MWESLQTSNPKTGLDCLIRTPSHCQDDLQFDMLEFFAGTGNVTRSMRASGLRVACFDILYPGSRKVRDYGSNPMDINSRSGFW